MPKSKRAKVVHLSKVEKKGREHSEALFAAVREAADAHPYIYVLAVENMRNARLKDVRADFSGSRLIFGKTRIMSLGLGLSTETAHQPGVHALTPHLRNQSTPSGGALGLLFTPHDLTTVQTQLAAHTAAEFLRAGAVAPETVVVPTGAVRAYGDALEGAREEVELRRLGMPTRLEKGRVVLEGEFEVCREGQVLDSRQATLLKRLGIALAEFRVRATAYWSRATEGVTVVEGGGEEMEE